MAHVLALAKISAAVALRDERLLDQELRKSLELGIQPAILREALLQTYLFAGYAATINAFLVLNRLLPKDSPFNLEDYKSWETWKERGVELCRQIYGDQFEKLISNMNTLHPDLAEWMLVEGYGKVLGRPLLSPMVRELLIISMTAVLNVPRQFHSHVRGALNVGATADQIQAVFLEIQDFITPQSGPDLWRILDDSIRK